MTFGGVCILVRDAGSRVARFEGCEEFHDGGDSSSSGIPPHEERSGVRRRPSRGPSGVGLAVRDVVRGRPAATYAAAGMGAHEGLNARGGANAIQVLETAHHRAVHGDIRRACRKGSSQQRSRARAVAGSCGTCVRLELGCRGAELCPCAERAGYRCRNPERVWDSARVLLVGGQRAGQSRHGHQALASTIAAKSPARVMSRGAGSEPASGRAMG